MIVDETLLDLDVIIGHDVKKILEVIIPVPVVIDTWYVEDADKINTENGYARDFVEVCKICKTVGEKTNTVNVKEVHFEIPYGTVLIYCDFSDESRKKFQDECMKLFSKNKYIRNSPRKWLIKQQEPTEFLSHKFEQPYLFVMFREK